MNLQVSLLTTHRFSGIGRSTKTLLSQALNYIFILIMGFFGTPSCSITYRTPIQNTNHPLPNSIVPGSLCSCFGLEGLLLFLLPLPSKRCESRCVCRAVPVTEFRSQPTCSNIMASVWIRTPELCDELWLGWYRLCLIGT